MFFDYYFSYIFFSSLLVLGLSYKYMLIVLLMIELVVLNLSMLIGVYFSLFGLDFYMIYYLVFSVCESVLGMSLLVMIIRLYGSESYSFFDLMKFYDKIDYFNWFHTFYGIVM
nr:TPA_asm: NADH dehydrogenase subunit 4L [Pseudomyrmex concolor]